MTTEWQLSALNEVPERLIRFGRTRISLSILIVEDEDGLRIEARCGQKQVERIRIGYDRSRLAANLDKAWQVAVSSAVALIAGDAET